MAEVCAMITEPEPAVAEQIAEVLDPRADGAAGSRDVAPLLDHCRYRLSCSASTLRAARSACPTSLNTRRSSAWKARWRRRP